jgi:hypothetical protein
MRWVNDSFWVIWALAMLLLIAYASVLAFGAPYLPTLKKTQADAIKLIDLKKGQLLVDLGSGDGSVLGKAAASGLRAVGYELNPFLFVYSWFTTRRHGRQVKVVLGNFWRADISQADGIFLFLLDRYMEKFDDFINNQSHKKLRVVSHAFKIPGKKPIKKVGALFLYEYPASRKAGE